MAGNLTPPPIWSREELKSARDLSEQAFRVAWQAEGPGAVVAACAELRPQVEAVRTWGGHAFPLLNYGPVGAVCVTWGLLKTMTWSWIETYVDECYAVLGSEWAPGGRKAPSGFALEELQVDLAAVAG